MKTQDAVESFHMLENSHKVGRGVHQAIKAWRKCIISFIKLLVSDLTKRKTIYEARFVYFYFFHGTKLLQLEDSQPYCSRRFRAL